MILQCPKCPKAWKWPWELRRHLLTHFKPDKNTNVEAVFECLEQECGRTFSWKRDLQTHKTLHTDKALVCTKGATQFRVSYTVHEKHNKTLLSFRMYCSCGLYFTFSNT